MKLNSLAFRLFATAAAWTLIVLPLVGLVIYSLISGLIRESFDNRLRQHAWVLQSEINPGLASHGGKVSLELITPDNEVVLRFGGGCHGCGMVNVTLQDGIEKTLKEYFPEIKAVIDATDHASGSNPYYK